MTVQETQGQDPVVQGEAPQAQPQPQPHSSNNVGASSIADAWSEAAEGFVGLGEFQGTIKESYFDTNTNAFEGGSDYGETVLLVWEVAIDRLIDPPDFPFDTAKLYYSVGKSDNWSIIDGGKAIAYAKEGKGRMGNSKYQQLIARVMGPADKGGLAVPLAERNLLPTQASVWLDLTFHFQQEVKDIPERLLRPGGPTTSRITLPKAWLQNVVPPVPLP